MNDETKLLIAAIQYLSASVECFRRLRTLATDDEGRSNMDTILMPLEMTLQAFKDAVLTRIPSEVN